LLDSVRIVLVEPASSGNIGSTARVMKNVGLSNLYLVNPPGQWDTPEARAMAHASGEILDACHVVEDLPLAVKDCQLVVGTTHREGKQRDAIYAPEQIIKKISPLLPQQQVALVFGREKDGLWQDELLYCQYLVRFPSAISYPSYNLSHAVLLFAYELFKVTQQPLPPTSRQQPLAPHADRERMFTRLEEALSAIGFAHHNNDTRHFSRAVRRFFNKMDIEMRDIRVILKICNQVRRFSLSLRRSVQESQSTNE
jgi:TrmH family RNA methyltransferase